jgi:hypothetical protein
MKETHLGCGNHFSLKAKHTFKVFNVCSGYEFFLCVYGLCFKHVLRNQLFANHFCYAFATLILIVCFVLIWQQ